MDPNEALNVIRAEIHEILHGDKPDPATLAETVNGLDEWLSKGGFLPDAWQPELSDFHDAEARHMLESEG